MGAITEIFKSFADEYLAQYPGCPGRHRKVINAIINCRSGEYGATAYRCEGAAAATSSTVHAVTVTARNASTTRAGSG